MSAAQLIAASRQLGARPALRPPLWPRSGPGRQVGVWLAACRTPGPGALVLGHVEGLPAC